MKEYHLYYSPSAADRYGYVLYRLADGREVEVTYAVELGRQEEYRWSDKEYVGVGVFSRGRLYSTAS